MRKLLLVVGLAVCMAGIAGAELFTNNGFEDDFTDWQEWGGGSGSGDWGYIWSSSNWVNVIEDPSVAHSGNKFVESGIWLEPMQMNWWGWGSSLVYQEPLVVAGDTYTLSAWVRDGWDDGSEDTIPAGISWEWRGEDNNNDGRGDIIDMNGNGTPDENEDKIHTTFEVPKDGSWVLITDTQVAPEGALYVTVIVTTWVWNTNLYIDDVSFMTNKAHNPQPADGATVPETLDTMSWENPDPNNPADPITCDVYFAADYPEAGLYEGDPNFLNYAQQIADDEAITSVSIPQALVFGQTYYWRVDCTDPVTGTTAIGHVWKFTVSNFAPDVEAGDDVYAWLTDGSVVVNLEPTVTDDDNPDPPAAFTVEWALTAGDTGTISITDPLVENAEVTLTAVGDYELELSADDSELSGSDTITIHVYDNACDATKASPIELPATDINEDCAVNIADLALMAENFGNCMSYDCL